MYMYYKGPVNIHWGEGGPVQKAIGHILFSAKIIIELSLFFNLSIDRIVIFFSKDRTSPLFSH